MSEVAERLRELQQVSVPADLDALVLGRARQEFLHASRPETHVGQHAAALRATEGVATVVLPRLERWVYAVGLLAYGSQAAGSAARLLWHAFRG
jgi:hypothetical protein